MNGPLVGCGERCEGCGIVSVPASHTPTSHKTFVTAGGWRLAVGDTLCKLHGAVVRVRCGKVSVCADSNPNY